MIHLGDITKLRGWEVPAVDVVTGGSPCQNFSVAGNRKGLGGDESVLFYHQIRLVKEMREHDRRTGRAGMYVRPRYCIWENVPGAFSSNSGKDFQAVLTEFVRVADPEAPDVPMPEKGKWPKAGCLYDELGRWSVAWRVHDAQFWGVPQRRKRISLVADFGGLSAPEILFERKGLSGDFEPGGAQGENTARSIGESAESAIGIDLYNQTTTGNVSKTLNSVSSDADHTPCVIHEPLCIEMTNTRNTVVEDGISPTLTARMGTGGNQVNAVMGFPLGFRAENTKCYYEAATTICNGTRPGFCAGVIEPMNIIRRLTPLECERLQGFPDNWTDIGDWTDSKGKPHKAADSPRYKALGNSIALPFWQYLARRICAQYERPVTMASLFDGIGGFPLVFERCGAKAVWASEIEEFPMAVTKARFKEEQ